MSEETLIGEPVFGSNSQNQRPNIGNANWKLDKEGSHIYRVLPPFGLLARSGRWSFYEAIHWGFGASNGKKRPFRCILRKNRKTGMVEQECPMCTWISQQVEMRSNKEIELKQQKRTDAEIKDILKPLDLWIRNYNLEKAHFVNALRTDGQIGRLKIRIKCKQNLDVLIKKHMERGGANPISAREGLWLEFQRVGQGRETTYPVEVVQEEMMVNGKRLKADKEAPLTNELIKRMAAEAWELSTGYRELTYDQIKMLVGARGEAEMVDSVFGSPKVSETVSSVVEDEPELDDETPEMRVLETESPKEDDKVKAEEEALLAQLAALRSTRSQVAKPELVMGPPPVETKRNPVKEISTEEFLKAFNTGKL